MPKWKKFKKIPFLENIFEEWKGIGGYWRVLSKDGRVLLGDGRMEGGGKNDWIDVMTYWKWAFSTLSWPGRSWWSDGSKTDWCPRYSIPSTPRSGRSARKCTWIPNKKRMGGGWSCPCGIVELQSLHTPRTNTASRDSSFNLVILSADHRHCKTWLVLFVWA